jgi:hypothetical protein
MIRATQRIRGLYIRVYTLYIAATERKYRKAESTQLRAACAANLGPIHGRAIE